MDTYYRNGDDTAIASSRDKRWCLGSTGRIGEYGVIGAEQADESHFDDRSSDEEEGDVYGADGRIKFSTKQLYGRQNDLRKLVKLWGVMMSDEDENDGEIESPSNQQNGTTGDTDNGPTNTKNQNGSGEKKNYDANTSSTLTPCTAWIAGYSGCGKTSLVEEFVKQISKQKKLLSNPSSNRESTPEDEHRQQFRNRQNHLFLCAKYSQSQMSSGPFGALGTLFDKIDRETLKELQLLRQPLLEAMGDDATILCRVFPGLCQEHGLFGANNGDGDASVGSGGGGVFNLDNSLMVESITDSHNGESQSSVHGHHRHITKITKGRLKFILQYFFRVLCTKERPLILFLDDLQWADDQSLELIQSMLVDPQLRYFFFVGAYRSNEVNADDGGEHKLIKAISNVENQNMSANPNQPNVRLELKELTMGDVGLFIADSLRLDPDQVEPLTQAVFTKTLGNPFFTRQALEQLVRKNALYYDTIAFEWSWNLRQQELEELLSDDIIEMVKNKIRHLSPELQRMLVVASCTRSNFHVETLLEVMHPELAAFHARSGSSRTIPTDEDYQTKKETLIGLLEQAVLEGLLVTSTTGPHEHSFAHDRIEEAARSFVDDYDRESFLAQIGEALYVRANSPHGEEWMYFAAAQNLNASTDKSRPLSDDERLRLAGLNHKTAELSFELLAFPAAIDFCKHGVSKLLEINNGKDVWGQYYPLALSLYSIGAEAAYGVGNSEQASQYCQEIFKQKEKRMSIFEFLPAYKVHLDILAGKGEKSEAYNISFAILQDMGFTFPEGERMQRVRAWSTLKKVRSRYIPTEESINDMPHVSDPMLIETFEFLQKAGSFAYQAEKLQLYVLVCCEAVRWMSKNGLTDGSAVAIASFANVLMHVYGDFDTGSKLAELAILITNRLKKKFNEPRALNTANAFVLSWVRPLRSRLKYHNQAYESGMASGNVEGASVARMKSSWTMMYAGTPLVELESFCREGIPQLRKMELSFDAHLICMVWQASLNLLGRSNSTTVLVGEAMDENAAPYANPPFNLVVDIWKRYLAVFFGDWEAGATNSLETGDICAKKMSGMMFGMEPFIRGMLLWGMARKSKESKYKKAAQQVLKQIKELVKKGCVNLFGPHKLLEAEQAAIAGKKRQARSCFEEAISMCDNGQFHQYAALANERYAVYLQEIGDTEAAKQHMSQAIVSYGLWGATKKVDLLQRDLSIFTSTDTGTVG